MWNLEMHNRNAAINPSVRPRMRLAKSYISHTETMPKMADGARIENSDVPKKNIHPLSSK